VTTHVRRGNSGSIFSDPRRPTPIRWHGNAAAAAHPGGGRRSCVCRFPQFPGVLGHHQARRRDGDRNVTPSCSPTRPSRCLTPSKRIATMGDTPGADADPEWTVDRHKAHRNIVNDWFKPGKRQVDAGSDRRTGAPVRRPRWWRSATSATFVKDVALHYPLQVILSILGLPADDYGRMPAAHGRSSSAPEDPDIERH